MTRVLVPLPLVAALAVVASGCDGGLATPPEQNGIETAAFDWSIDPCVDFYQFACGNWARWNGIYPNGAARDRSHDVQEELINLQVRLVVEDAQGKAHPNDPDAIKIGQYYSTCRTALEGDAKTAPELQSQLMQIAEVATLSDLAQVMGRLRVLGTGSLFGIGVQVNPDFPMAAQLFVGPGGLGMTRAYFLDADKASFRAAYAAHVDALVGAVMSANGPLIPGALTGELVLRIETALAAATPEDEVWRDPRAVHHATPAEALAAMVPAFDWIRFFEAAGVPPLGDVDVDWPPFLPVLNDLLRTTPIEDLKAYLAWRALERATKALGRTVLGLEFAFHSQLFFGQAQDVPVWWRCFNYTTGDLGFALSRPFVARVFSESQRGEALRVLEAIRARMKSRLASEPWLDEGTRAEALTKLGQIEPKIGFPDKWPSYDDYVTSSVDYLRNVVNRRAKAWRNAMEDLGKTVDRAEWNAAPIVTNAFYDPLANDITFPAAILQPPFFQSGRAAAMNYGSIGSIMGHELTHAFDDSGRQYDGLGTLRDWWSPGVAEEFSRRAACLVDQFDAVHPLPGTMVNGALTLGENIADLGGLRLAYDAFHADDGGKGEGAPGYFSPDQQFFISYAQGACEQDRPSYLKWLLETDEHAPWKARVNGAVANVPAFAAAFQCSAGAPLAPTTRCEIW